MVRIRVAIRLRFTRLPNVSDERIFRDTLLVTDPDARSYQDLSNMVEKKLSFMEIPPCDFTVFFVEPSGDRVVVDDAYFAELMQDWLRRAEAAHAEEALHGPSRDILGLAPSSEDEDDEWDIREVHTSFDVEVNRLRNLGVATGAVPLLDGSVAALTPPSSAATGIVPTMAVRSVPLTVQNLAQLKTANPASAAAERVGPDHLTPPVVTTAAAVATSEQLVTVGELQCPPSCTHFVLRCVLLAVRVKLPKPDLTVAELDLCDAAQPAQQITAVTFDAVVQRAIREHLRADRRHVIELRQVYVRRKTETDVRYQTNGHPLLLRLDRHSRMDVVQVLSTPVALPTDVGGSNGGSGLSSVDEAGSGVVVRVREVMPSGGVLELARGGRGVALSSSSSSTQSVAAGVRRTTFTLSRGTSQGVASGGGVGPVSAASALVVAPADLGWQTRCQQERFLAQRPVQPRPPVEPGVVQVTSEDVRRREPLLQQQVNKEVDRKERIRRRCGTVSTSCLLCGLDCDNEKACMPLVRRLLEANYRNKGRVIPTLDELRSALADHRRVAAGATPTRLVCRRTFVNVQTRTVHIVHCRCAHLCTSYQRGGELEDIVLCEMPMQLCTLCGLPGATVSCYHPDCKEMYHTICALYSGEYVNFGKKDPYLPCPACPRHTLVNLKPKAIDDVLHVDTSCWDDGIAFDSRVVESTDLRDPDENEGA